MVDTARIQSLLKAISKAVDTASSAYRALAAYGMFSKNEALGKAAVACEEALLALKQENEVLVMVITSTLLELKGEPEK